MSTPADSAPPPRRFEVVAARGLDRRAVAITAGGRFREGGWGCCARERLNDVATGFVQCDSVPRTTACRAGNRLDAPRQGRVSADAEVAPAARLGAKRVDLLVELPPLLRDLLLSPL